LLIAAVLMRSYRVQLEKAHRAELAKRHALLKEKDAEISRLNARLCQFEHVAAMMSAVAQPAAAVTSGSSKKRSRRDMPLQSSYECC
jgi:hypothetical protein